MTNPLSRAVCEMYDELQIYGSSNPPPNNGLVRYEGMDMMGGSDDPQAVATRNSDLSKTPNQLIRNQIDRFTTLGPYHSLTSQGAVAAPATNDLSPLLGAAIHDPTGQIDVSNPSPSSSFGESRFECERLGCGKVYKRKGELTRHVWEKHGPPVFRCPVLECKYYDRGFVRKEHYLNHIRTHNFSPDYIYHQKQELSTKVQRSISSIKPLP